MEIPRNPQIISYPDSSFRTGLSLPNLPLQGSQAVEQSELCRNLARKLSQSVFDNLEDFPYLYFTAGVTEAIDFLVPRQKTTILKEEYRYVRGFSTVSESHAPKDEEAFFFTYPFAGTGRFEPIPLRKNIILDCSYIFASNMNCKRTLPDEVSYVLFGLTKSHNLSDARVGWMFSKTKILTYHVLQYEYGYIGGLLPTILRKVSAVAPNELYVKHQKSLSELYLNSNLTEVDTNLFGLNKLGERVPYYLLK